MIPDKIFCPKCGKENKQLGTCEFCGADLTSEFKKLLDSAMSSTGEEGSKAVETKEHLEEHEEQTTFDKLPITFDERVFVKTYNNSTGETVYSLKILQNWTRQMVLLGHSKFQIEYSYGNGKGKFLCGYLGEALGKNIFNIETWLTPMSINLGGSEVFTTGNFINCNLLGVMCDAPRITIKRCDYVYDDTDGILKLILQAFYNLLIDSEKYKDSVERLYKYASDNEGAHYMLQDKKIFEQFLDKNSRPIFTTLKLFRNEKKLYSFDIDGTFIYFHHMDNNDENEDKDFGFYFKAFSLNNVDLGDGFTPMIVSTGQNTYRFDNTLHEEELEILCEATTLSIQQGDYYIEDRKGLLRIIARIYYNVYYNKNRYTDTIEKFIKPKKKDAKST